MAPHKAILVSLLSLTLSGCACVASKQDWHYRLANKRRAAEAFRCCYSLEQVRSLSCDFEDGFKTGFVDTSIGKDCRVPPVPPSKYWKAKYQCCEGQTAIQDWFRGYQCGITAAESKGYPSFNDIPVSSQAPVLNKTACGMCRSCDPCECSAQAASMLMHPQEVHAMPSPSDSGYGSSAPEVPTADPPSYSPGDAAAQGRSDYDDYFHSAESKVESTGIQVDRYDTTAETQPGVVEEVPTIGLIGGLGATQATLIGPIDQGIVGSPRDGKVVSASTSK